MNNMVSLRKQEKWDKTLSRFSFFLIMNILVIVTNLSFFFFLQLLFSTKKFSIKKILSFFALLMAIGATMSAAFTPHHPQNEFLLNSLRFLPNYLYWAFMLIFFVHHRDKINVEKLQKTICIAVIVIVPYFFFRKMFLSGISIIPKISQNSLSFILIAYSPIAIYYILKKKGRYFAYAFFIFLLLFLLSQGRRSGFMLVGLGGFGVLSIKSFSLKQGIITSLTILLVVIAINTSVVENFFKSSNDRIYGLIYESENITTEDRSYLTRRLMLEKSLIIFKKYPYTGVGLVNFTKYEVQFLGNFPGAHYIIKKRGINKLSPHNSYAGLLAEGGLVVFIPVILILGSLLLYFITSFNKIPEAYRPFFWGIIGAVVHFTSINSISNAAPWFLISMTAALTYKKPVNSTKVT